MQIFVLWIKRDGIETFFVLVVFPLKEKHVSVSILVIYVGSSHNEKRSNNN